MLAGGFSARFIDSERQSMGASSICFECPAGVFARPVLRTISAVSGVNGGGECSSSEKNQTTFIFN